MPLFKSIGADICLYSSVRKYKPGVGFTVTNSWEGTPAAIQVQEAAEIAAARETTLTKAGFCWQLESTGADPDTPPSDNDQDSCAWELEPVRRGVPLKFYSGRFKGSIPNISEVGGFNPFTANNGRLTAAQQAKMLVAYNQIDNLVQTGGEVTAAIITEMAGGEAACQELIFCYWKMYAQGQTTVDTYCYRLIKRQTTRWCSGVEASYENVGCVVSAASLQGDISSCAALNFPNGMEWIKNVPRVTYNDNGTYTIYQTWDGCPGVSRKLYGGSVGP